MGHKPDFFIIGAPKCGTTSLYHWLKDHPQIFMPDAKEPHYFAPELSDRYCRVREQAAYLDLFSAAQEGQICGEASVLYCFYLSAIQNILKFNPEAKFIFMLRSPVDMVVSYHGQLLANLEEDIEDVETAWNIQQERSLGRSIPKTSTDSNLLQYSEICALGMHLQGIAEIIPSGQLKVILLDDVATSAHDIYTQLLDFLNLRDDARVDFGAMNEAVHVKSKLIQKIRKSENVLLRVIKKILKKLLPKNMVNNFNTKPKEKITLSADFKAQLLDVFSDDIKIIEEYLEKDLSDWRKLS